jgi:streptomycin 6-kinase
VPGGSEWLDRLPRLVDECAEQWGLELGRPMLGGYCSFVAPAGDAVLKVGFPHEESEHEALALRLWDGEGAVRLLAEDAERHALLLERCVPGTALLELDDDGQCDVVAGLLPQLWRPPPPKELRQLAVVAARWVHELPSLWEQYERPFEQRLLDAAVNALVELGPSQGELVIGNEDLHGANILRATRDPWLVIDPKPIAAEREFGPVAMIRDVKELVDGPMRAERLQRRLERLSSELGLDRERVRGWTIAHTIAWGFESGRFDDRHAEIARLLL